MPTRTELEAEINLLKEILEAETVRANEWREIAERISKSFSDLTSIKKQGSRNTSLQ